MSNTVYPVGYVSPVELAKAERAQAVAGIKVTTTAGNTFDGDEDAQSRMARAVLVLGESESVSWVLADNTVTLVGKAELQEALRLAGEAMSAIWTKPYQG